MITWKPNYTDFQEVFSNENALRILALLSLEKQQYCAADIARLLDIHISTSKKYLDLFFKHNLIEKEYLPNKPGKPTYFSSKVNQINISLDMHNIALTLTEKFDKEAIPNPLVRERPNLDSEAKFGIDNKGLVRNIVIKKRTKARRYVKQKVELSKTESLFMKYLPHPTMDSEYFLQLCQRAKITNYFEIKSLLSFIEKLEKLNIIEVIETLK
ncbi:MAG: hypothetical protein ACW98G_13295 [Candidatus Hodarchaeales archaeon]